MRCVALALAMALSLPGLATGGERPTFYDRPAAGQTVRFTDAGGHVFQPDRLVIVSAATTVAASLPASTSNAYSEDHLDFSSAPLIGQVFRPRTAASDAERDGILMGPLTRFGDTLVLDARNAGTALDRLSVVLTAEFPRDGGVSYHLGQLPFAPSATPAGNGRPAGAAYLLDGRLVLAGPGRRPLITDWGRLIGN